MSGGVRDEEMPGMCVTFPYPKSIISVDPLCWNYHCVAQKHHFSGGDGGGGGGG